MTRDGHLPGRLGGCVGEIMLSAYGYALVSRSVRDVNPGTSGEFIEVVVTRLDAGPDAVRAAAELLSDGERQRATRFAFDRDRCRFVVARSRLRQLLGERLEVRPDALDLASGVRGKPALAGRFADSDLRFNLSHCDDVAVYALAYGREVGIDVEAVRVVPDADAIAACMFSRAENEVYRALDARDKPVGFFNCWTRKEAFIKALGDGLSYPLDRFDVSLAPGDPPRILRVASTTGDACGWTLHAFPPGPGLIGAVVVQQVDRGSTFRVGGGFISGDGR